MALTWASAWTQFTAGVKLIDDRRADWAGSYLTQEAVVLQANVLDANNATVMAQGVAGFRANLDGANRSGSSVLSGILSQIGTLAKFPETDSASVLVRLKRYMIDNPDSISPAPRVASRGIVPGAWTPIASVGTGTVRTLDVDEDGMPNEGTFCETETWTCTRDRQSGTAAGQESFEVRGLPKPDTLTYYNAGYGSGLKTTIACMSADDSAAIVLNPSFSDFSGTVTALTALNNWTVSSSLANFNIDQTNYYRPAVLESTPASLQILATDTITQLLSNRKAALSTTDPIYGQIAWNRQVGSGTGTLVFSFGNQSATVVAAAQTGWQVLVFPANKNAWIRNYDADNLAVSVAWTRTSGGGTWVNVDDIVLCAWRLFAGRYRAPVGGATNFLIKDQGTLTNTEGVAPVGRVQRTLQRLFSGAYLPTAPTAPTVVPVLTQTGTAGIVTTGTHATAYSLIDSYGNESAPTAISNVVTFDGSHQGNLAFTLPAQPSGIVSFQAYASHAGTTTPLYKFGSPVAYAAGATNMVYNVADVSLTVASAGGVTILDP